MILDTHRAIETPEGVELQLRVAGPVVRALAWLIDFLIRLAVYYAGLMAFATFGNFGIGLFLVLIFLLEWFYPVAFEVYRQGRTPGKQVMGIQVVNDNGTPVSWGPAMVRNLLRAVDFLPLFYGFGLSSMLMNRDFKRLGDLAAGTQVVYREAVQVAAAVPAATPQAFPLPLRLEEQRAVIAYAERLPRLTDERAEELADILTPLTRLAGRPAMARLVQTANWLLGKR